MLPIRIAFISSDLEFPADLADGQRCNRLNGLGNGIGLFDKVLMPLPSVRNYGCERLSSLPQHIYEACRTVIVELRRVCGQSPAVEKFCLRVKKAG
jgi:hypothetical protein